jgi:hypothetical protein
MSTANPNPMEKSMVSVLVVANAGGGVAVAVWLTPVTCWERERSMVTPSGMAMAGTSISSNSVEIVFSYSLASLW